MVSERHRVSYCRFCENSVSKLLSEKSDGTLWVEFTHSKEVSEKASLQVGLRLIPYSPWISMISKTSLMKFHKMSARRLPHKNGV